MQKLRDKHLQMYLQQATKIQLPLSFKELQKKHSIKEMEEICRKELGADQPAQCMSAQFIDSNQQPVLFYFGDRVLLPRDQSGVRLLLIKCLQYLI